MNLKSTLHLAHSELTGAIIGSGKKVYDVLGDGFFESVYIRSVCVELTKRGIPFEREKPFVIRYSGEIVGEYRADLVVNDLVIVEAKAVEKLTAAHSSQTLNYLKVSGLPIGLLLNFGPTPQVRRLVNPQLGAARGEEIGG